MTNGLHASSRGAILKATVWAFLVALVLLAIVVLPAEYGADPTGVGKLLGLTGLGEAKMQVHNVLRNRSEPGKYREDTVTLTLKPGQGLEYKFLIVQGSAMLYSWTATESLNYDFHGEPKGARPDYFESYEKKAGNRAHGSFIASFEGTHGWYWKKKPPSRFPSALPRRATTESWGFRVTAALLYSGPPELFPRSAGGI